MLDLISGQIADLLIGLAQNNPIAALLISILGTLLVVASAIIAVTPPKTDDDWWSRLHGVPLLGAVLGALERFSLIRRKE